jgi:hypothetical protein
MLWSVDIFGPACGFRLWVPGFRRSPLEPSIFEEFKNLVLSSGEPIQAWVEYDALKSLPNLTLAPFYTSQLNLPLLSLDIDISPIILPQVYVQGVVGFSEKVALEKFIEVCYLCQMSRFSKENLTIPNKE